MKLRTSISIFFDAGPVDDGSDTILHYSPLVDRGRPLDRILFAFHACANILGFIARAWRPALSKTLSFGATNRS